MVYMDNFFHMIFINTKENINKGGGLNEGKRKNKRINK